MGEVFSIRLDFEACLGCGDCLELCPGNVFDPGRGRNAKGRRPPVASRQGDCLGCGSCAEACPGGCLEMERGAGSGG